MHIDNAQMITIIASILIPMLAGFGFIVSILLKFEGRFTASESRFSSLESKMAKIETDVEQLKTIMNTLISYLLDQRKHGLDTSMDNRWS